MMIFLAFPFLLVVYGVIVWVIIYHLKTYTINKDLARTAIRFFSMITVVLVVIQIVLFVFAISSAREGVQMLREEYNRAPGVFDTKF